LKEIRRYQKSTKLFIFKVIFDRVVKKIFQKMRKFFRIQSIALQTLQKTTKTMIVIEFENNCFVRLIFVNYIILTYNYNCKSLCHTRQKNYFVSEEFKSAQRIEKSARILLKNRKKNKNFNIELIYLQVNKFIEIE
jgi:hypothetical protein